MTTVKGECRYLPSPLRIFIPVVMGLWLSLLTSAHGQEPTTDTPDELINHVLNASDHSPAEHVEFATRAQNLLREAETPDRSQLARAGFALSRALLTAGRIDDAVSEVDRGLENFSEQDSPDSYLSLRALRGVLMLTQGQAEAGLAHLEVLLKEEHSNVRPATQLEIRSHYAAGLYINGQASMAIDVLQQVIRDGIDQGQDRIVLTAGNNLMVLLIEQRLYADAAEWITRFQTAMEGLPGSWATHSIQLHDLQLKQLRGDVSGAIAGLEAFLEQPIDRAPLITGSAYELLARARRAQGDLAGSEIAARSALRILGENAIEAAEALTTLARVLLDTQRYGEVLALLDDPRMTTSLTPIRKANYYELRLQALLGQAGSEELLRDFERYLTASAEVARTATEQTARYYDAILTTQRQQSQLEIMEDNRSALEKQAAASEERAREAKRSRNLLVALVLLSAMATIIIARALSKQKMERELRVRQEDQNRRLTDLVEAKSGELVQQANEQAELERQFARRAKSDAIGQLTGHVAHDFNNLMQVVMIANEQLAEVDLQSNQRELLDASERSLNHAATIIRQLLAFARRQQLEAQPTTFSNFLEQTKTLLDSALGQEVVLQVEDHAGTAAALVDASQLTTALLNLLANARDAMPDGGVVTLESREVQVVDGTADGWPSLDPGAYLSIVVIDRGAGMTEAEVARACEPFYTTKESYAGTGLGLSSVFGFVKQSRGDLKIESEVGVGTRVSLMFPCVESLNEVAPSVAAESLDLSGTHVLLVDDDETLANSLTHMLHQQGACVTPCKSGDAAIRVLSEDVAFDLVLSDVRMPGKNNGIALADWARNHQPNLPVLLMTGFHDQPINPSDFSVIHKPFTREELLRQLRTKLTIRSEPISAS